ncbi:MAG: rod shape-determining protein [Methanopyri archaeon]|nr:rod shape-determining protein [Methanopyri archaeon]
MFGRKKKEKEEDKNMAEEEEREEEREEEHEIEPEEISIEFTENSLGIDLGTMNTVVARPMEEEFKIKQFPSVVAVKKGTNKVLAIGEEARKMLGRTPEDIIAVRPLRHGVIESVEYAKFIVQHAIEVGSDNDPSSIERVAVGVPGDATEVEREAIKEATAEVGISKDNVIVINEALAAAIGSGLPIAEPDGTMIVDAGAGSTDVAVISLGGITDQETMRIGGDDIDRNIVELVEEEYNVRIGIHEAEKAKIEVGMVFTETEDIEVKEIEVIGKDMTTNKPKQITIDSELVARAAEPVVQDIVRAINRILDRIPSELVSGIYENTVLVGGTSMMRGFRARIEEETDIPARLADDPLTVVAKGAAIVAAEPRTLEPEVRLRALR